MGIMRFLDANTTANITEDILNRLVYNKHIASITIIEVLAAIGLVVWAAGYRFIRPTMFLAGVLMAFMLFYIFSPMLFDTQLCCGHKGKEYIHILASLAVGLLGGILGCRLYRLGVFTIGQCLGMVVALAILSTPLYVYFKSNVVYGCFMTVVSLMFGTLAHFFEKPLVIVASACTGSFALLYGVDHFIKTSFSVTMESFLLRVKNVAFDGLKSKYSNWTYRVKTPDHMAVHFTTDAIPMFICWLLLVIMGFVIQHKITARNLNGSSSLCQFFNCFSCCGRTAPDN